MSRLFALPAALVLAGSLLGAALVPSSAGARPAAPAPHIAARPHTVVVGATTKLTGTHFAASTRLTIEECPESTWLVTANPCPKGASIKVKTNPQGQFQAVFTVRACAPSATSSFTETCYVGSPKPSGIDTISLQGAATLTVTSH